MSKTNFGDYQSAIMTRKEESFRVDNSLEGQIDDLASDVLRFIADSSVSKIELYIFWSKKDMYKFNIKLSTNRHTRLYAYLYFDSFKLLQFAEFVKVCFAKRGIQISIHGNGMPQLGLTYLSVEGLE